MSNEQPKKTLTATNPDPASYDSIVHDHDEAPHITRRLLLCVDSSPSAEYMLHWAIDNLIDPKRDLVIVTHVRSVAYVPGGYGMVAEGIYIRFVFV